VVELMMFVLVLVMVVAVVAGWRVLSRPAAEQIDDARSVVTPGPNGTMTVAVSNPASEPVVVTACARPASSVHLLGRDRVIRPLNAQERRNSTRAPRQLLGSVAAGDQSTWVVMGDATTSKVCRVILSIYQPGGRVRVHEHVVQSERVATPSSTGPRPLARPPHRTTTD
jgi:hypothetical protein